MNRIIFGMALAAMVLNLDAAPASADGSGAARPAPPIPPNWEPILTRPGALAKGSGHVQGFCVTSNAMTSRATSSSARRRSGNEERMISDK